MAAAPALNAALRRQQLLMATGTLADQLTYPYHIDPEDRTPEKEAELTRLLEIVGIDYLVKRWSERDVVGTHAAALARPASASAASPH